MNLSIELPEKCHKCAKSVASIVDKRCNFCQELGFQEEVLCHLNRCIQEKEDFKCHTFQPKLRITGTTDSYGSRLDEDSKQQIQKQSYSKLLQSDKLKYERALALQKLDRDPDGVYMSLKYHFAWNVVHRKPLFKPVNDFFNFIHDAFFNSRELVGGFVTLLWLAPDHVHVYVESDGERSVETMVKEIKRFSEKKISQGSIEIKNRLSGKIEIWDKAYFSGTIG